MNEPTIRIIFTHPTTYTNVKHRHNFIFKKTRITEKISPVIVTKKKLNVLILEIQKIYIHSK